MKSSQVLAVVALALVLAAGDAPAKRFGGGGNIGKQRPSPTMREAPKDAPSAAPAPTAPAQAAPAPAAQPSFMGKWGGMLAGLGIGALVGSIFGTHLGEGAGFLLLLVLVGGIVFVLYRALAPRRDPATRPVQFAGIGSALPPSEPMSAGGVTGSPAVSESLPPGFETAPFLRVAKTSFIRLQAANDAGDLDDIRDYTSPEMYAELAMQIRDRGDAPQRTEVVTLDAQLVEALVEGDYEIASVRFRGLIREKTDGNSEPFDELWHVRKSRRDPKAVWLIAGIQQTA